MKKAISLILFQWIVVSVFAQTAKEEKLLTQFKTEDHIVFKTIDGDTLDLMLFFPEEIDPSKKAPVMLYTHGGGWGKGDKFRVLKLPTRKTLKQLTEAGVVVAAIEYRLTRKGISDGEACVKDCIDAARFLIQNAKKYQLDTNRMGVFGGSAGGHLALMTGLANPNTFVEKGYFEGIQPNFKCIVSYFPLVSFTETELNIGTNFEKPERFVKILGGPYQNNLYKAKLLSPVTHLKSDSPPTLLIHGDNDTVLSFKQSEYFMEIAQSKKANVKLIRVKNGGHSFTGQDIQPTMPEINQMATDFILEHLLNEI